MVFEQSKRSRHYPLSLFRIVPTTVQGVLSYPMNTPSSRMVSRTVSYLLIYQVYASYLPNNLRYIFCLVRLRIPPLMHPYRLWLLFVYSLWLFFRSDGFGLFGHSSPLQYA